MNMRVICLLFIAISLRCDARPMTLLSNDLAPSFGTPGIDHYIIGGIDALRGAWPWQLSLQAYSTLGGWYHTCGATLLSPTKVLTASHCVYGRSASILRVIAGLYQMSDSNGKQMVGVSVIVMHERYELDESLGSTSNDIAVLHLESSISTDSNVEFASLPPNNINNFAGVTCTITGWGRTSSSNVLPDILKQADIGVITTQECSSRMSPIRDVNIWDNHICVFDRANGKGSCSGDSGGPLNCPDGYGGYYVAGVTSWGISNTATGTCLQTYPSVYTRTSAYLYWIFNN